MNFTHENPIFDKVTVRPYNEFDLSAVDTIIRSQTKMFGTNIVSMHDSIIQDYAKQKKNTFPYVAEYENKISGIMRITFWEGMPFWTVGANFTLLDSSLNYIKNRIISLLLYKQCMMKAEENFRYDGYILLPDINTKRKQLHFEMIPWIRDRYDVRDVEIIPPFTESKWTAFRSLAGPFSGKNARTIVVRHSHLKAEYRNEN